MYRNPNFNASAYSKRFKAIRKSLNLTQEELGEKLGMKNAAICKIEKGKSLSLKGIIGVCALANCTLDWLILGIGEPPTGVQLEIPDASTNPG